MEYNDTEKKLSFPYPWQEPIWDNQLTKHIDQLPHGLLFVGQQGIGKYHLAQSLAYWLLCTKPVDNKPCGQCHGCMLNQVSNHPDLLVIEPENNESVIKIDTIRAVISFVNKTAQQGGKKIIIIHPAEAMNINSVNALLKSLEEPASDTFFFLVSHCYGALSATLRSRCQLLRLSVPNREVAKEWLLEQKIAKNNIDVLLNITAGAPLKALQWVENDFFELHTALVRDMLSMANLQLSPLEIAHKWQNYNITDLLNSLISWMGQLIKMFAVKNQSDFHKSHELVTLFHLLNEQVSVENLFKYYDILQDTRKSWLKQTNLNKQLLLENLLIRWVSLLT